ncbi:hypothetical protein BCR35DRAFT_156287 [Leucosporidium creatinivorum]|uniref:Uncharacterized protein n=1 Tax=Leucosporidium creatinivorum TaxID=106004 RepID=A0A1Y2FZR3_9BASI|nr:hypothetical protein BCR35DRAFT_156287 [Leucosporidium creatinivorum]
MRNRAKNALTRLSHALTYQVRTANGRTSGFDFSAEERALGGNGGASRGKPRARIDGGGGQTTLNFAPLAGSSTV